MKSTLKRTWAEIDLDALHHNYETLRRRVGTAKFLGVVKADAYGHGAVQVSRALQTWGADYLAVSSADEALELRENGITMPILILGYTPADQVPMLIEQSVTQAVTSEEAARAYSAAAVEYGGTLKIHIKADTGMSRLGWQCDDAHFAESAESISRVCAMPGLEAEGIFTHFAVSDEAGEKSEAYTRRQYDRFCRIIAAAEERWGRKFAIHHCANTGATACYTEYAWDMVRPGLLLYGYGEFAEKLGLRPVMSLKTTVSTVKIYAPGTDVSYGRHYTTDKVTRMGVVPYGYADGFLRVLSNRCSLMTADGPAPQRGRICMDMCMIDLTACPRVQPGDEVEIFGGKQSVDTLASLAGTIPYELTCAVSKRVPRLYLQGGEVVEKELLLRF